MGYTYGLTCRDCSYSIEIDEGIGFLHYPEQLLGIGGRHSAPLLLELIKDERIKEKTKVFIECDAALKEGYGYALYICSNCNKIYNHYHFQLDEYIPDYKCKCNTLLKRCRMDEHSKEVHFYDLKKREIICHCPECGGINWEYQPFMDWD